MAGIKNAESVTNMFMRAVTETFLTGLIAQRTDKYAATLGKRLTSDQILSAESRAEADVAEMFAPEPDGRPPRGRLKRIILLSLEGRGSESKRRTLSRETTDPDLRRLQRLVKETAPKTLRLTPRQRPHRTG